MKSCGISADSRIRRTRRSRSNFGKASISLSICSAVISIFVLTPAPLISRQKGPSNFNLRFFRSITVEPSGPDDLLVLPIYDDKGPAGFHRLSEENFEHIFFIAITLRMLFPNQRVGRDGKKI